MECHCCSIYSSLLQISPPLVKFSNYWTLIKEIKHQFMSKENFWRLSKVNQILFLIKHKLNRIFSYLIFIFKYNLWIGYSLLLTKYARCPKNHSHCCLESIKTRNHRTILWTISSPHHKLPYPKPYKIVWHMLGLFTEKTFYKLEMFYLNTIKQLFLLVEQLDHLEVCLPIVDF